MSTAKRELDAAATRELLLRSALPLFLQRGFGQVSAEELVRSAGLSRGALYHHFDGKLGLFRELVSAEQVKAARRMRAVMADDTDPLQSAIAGAREFLRMCCGREYREIVLLQGPIALGWDEWRSLDHEHLGGLVVAGVRAMQREGLLPPQASPDLLAAALYGALTELSLVVAHAPDVDAELERAAGVFESVLIGLGP
ncbi:TetR/AcrR family transcriptional regulator [Intrasporangium sp. DVR]|uniref:TetR/AcrR family transcriptional regulator n=1 Tax=Intrasporangium sp. DVR TaxID=3127867 RepID=UPI00313A71E7